MSEDIRYLMALSACERLDSLIIQELLKSFENAEEIWQAGGSELKSRGVPERICQNLIWWRGECSPDELCSRVKLLGLKVVDFRSKEYPVLLKETSDCPIILYVKGELGVDDLGIGIVGSRNITPYGQRMTERISQVLVDANIVIISGLALGIDGVSHKVAVGNKAKTVAVLAHGLDQVYPVVHENLARKIVECGGALVSEYPPGDLPLRHHFLHRNRIIAGLSLGTLVIEAAEKSGALTTARCALDYSRTVYAVPGDAERRQSAGTNNLIKQGALPVTIGEDILKDLNISCENTKFEKKNYNLAPQEVKILELLSTQPKHIDELSRELSIGIPVLSGILMGLEMRDVVKNVGGMKYISR